MTRSRVPSWLPNALTCLRIALVPAFVAHAQWCAEAVRAGEPGLEHRAAALAALVGIGASDVVDGWLARRFGLATPLGALLDAVADKLAQVTLLVYFGLVADGAAFARVPPWFVAVVIGRDLLLLAGSLAIRRRRGAVDVEHHAHGRVATVLLFALLVWLTADLDRALVLPACAAIALVVVASTTVYVRHGWRQWRGRASP